MAERNFKARLYSGKAKKMQKEEKRELQFYLGDFGAMLPFIMMLVTIVFLVVSGNKSAKNYWTGAFVGIVIAYILCVDKKEFNNA